MVKSIARSCRSHAFSCFAVAVLLGVNVGLRNVSAAAPPFIQQSFTFDWNGNESVPIPITAQCETIHITWNRDGVNAQINPDPPDPFAPYSLQVYTSRSPIPFIIDAGMGLSFDWDVPFYPDTLYQICMFDSNGASGGCQATYTVYQAPNTTLDDLPTCQNTTFPPSLNVTTQTVTGPVGQYAWVPQCTDISVTPLTGTPPFTLTIAPALHPIYNITSDSMDAINWTVTLGYGTPFFISLVDSQGIAWATGPVHSGGNGPTSCLDTDAANTTTKSSSTDDVAPGVAVGAGIGGLVGGLAIGILGTLLFNLRRSHRQPGTSVEKASTVSLVPQASLGERYQDLPSASGTEFSRSTQHTRNVSYQIEPFPFFASGSSGTEHTRELSAHALEIPLLSETSQNSPAVDDSTRPPHSASSTLPSRAMSPPVTPGTQMSADRAVYVVHHDGGRPPVTVYTSDGAEVVELPPEYPVDRQDRRVASESTAFFQSRGQSRSISKPRRVVS